MKMATFTPLPPLPPLPPIPLPGRDAQGKRTLFPSEKPNFLACKNSDKDIWKVGLTFKHQDLDVIFGDLKPDQVMGSIFNPKVNEQLSRSIIIPSQHLKVSKPGAGKFEQPEPKVLKYGGNGPFDGTLNSHRPQIAGVKNHRFKEYLKKYFPKENVIMQPMETVMKSKLFKTCE